MTEIKVAIGLPKGHALTTQGKNTYIHERISDEN